MDIPTLKLKIRQASHEYYTLGRPALSDTEYDDLVRQLAALEQGTKILADSPTQVVGGATGKIKHVKRMLSLDNTFSADEVVGWMGSHSIETDMLVMVEPKVDGLSISLHYVGGQLTKAVTRGDGTFGEDVTHVAKAIDSIPKSIPKFASENGPAVEVRGEVFMTKADFLALNVEMERTGDEPFSTPRNSAAGLLKRKDTSGAKWLSMIAYWANHTSLAKTQSEVHSWLNVVGFKSVSAYSSLIHLTNENLDQTIQTKAEKKSSWPFDVDGLVIKVESRAVQADLGDGTRSPNWAVAFKWPPTEKETTLLGITVQVGRLGTLTPVAELEPVTIDGTVIRRATLHNEDEIARLNIGVGDRVMVCRAAEVIPRVTRVVQKRKLDNQWLMPLNCPCCGSKVQRTSGLVAVICPNKDCSDQIFARLEHAVKKQSLDIDGCGEKAIRLLMDRGVKKLSDIFVIADFSFLGDAAGKRVAAGVKASKDQPLWRKLHALGVDGFGSTMCKEFCIHWQSLFTLVQKVESEGLDAVIKVLGPVVANNLMDYIHANLEELVKLQELGFVFENQVKAGPLTGKIFVITGSMVSGSRDEVMAWIENLGGTVKSSVGKSVHFLVNGPGAGVTKAAAARKNGTAIISEEDLYALAGQKVPVQNFSGEDDSDL